MSLSTALAGYANAVAVARRTRGLSLPGAVASVMAARLEHGLGSQFHSLFDLAGTPRERWGDFILDAEFNPVLQRINREHIPLADDKAAFATHCHRNGLPTIPTLCVIRSGDGAADRRLTVVTDAAAFERVLAAAPDRIFIKPLDGAHGVNAFAATRSDGGWRHPHGAGDARALFDFCAARTGTSAGWIVQPEIRAHAALHPIMPGGALGTIRAVTHAVRGKPAIVLAVLRIPAGGNRADNFAGGRSGNVIAPIDIRTGILGEGRVSRSRAWPEMTDVTLHPDTRERIGGRRLPLWDETRELLVSAQAVTPQLVTVGWDVAITDEGPVIVEANPGYDIDLLQVAHRRGIRADLAPVIAFAAGGQPAPAAVTPEPEPQTA